MGLTVEEFVRARKDLNTVSIALDNLNSLFNSFGQRPPDEYNIAIRRLKEFHGSLSKAEVELKTEEAESV